MKRIILFIALLLFTSNANADLGSSRAETGSTIRHRGVVVASDSVATISSVDVEGYTFVRMDFDVSGTNPHFLITPQCSLDTVSLFTDAATSETITVTKDSFASHELKGCNNINMKVTEVGGASAGIIIYLTPYNR